MTTLTELSCVRSFEGKQLRFSHFSESTQCEMTFSVYLPPQVVEGKVPALYWLSGLTCTDENFVQKAGAQQYAAEYGVAIIAPDTSPRGEGVADDPEGAWDFGLGAGFYLNATQAPFDQHYQMYQYISQELPDLIVEKFPIDSRKQGVFGHSMGGHGALTIGLKHPERFKSISAFAPICAPSQCAWGHKAFSNYLGDDQTQWKAYDSCELIKAGVLNSRKIPLLVEQGCADDFLTEQLKPELLQQACEEMGVSLELNYRKGYDHSYFFIASFIGGHIAFHAQQLAVDNVSS